ncbi:hypothetical protein B0J17DRAFT_645575 [Rhizoctonia solani]|nr:hypothetical protein B0J17DRAFT_645575 [Rhizoctonia solani]
MYYRYSDAQIKLKEEMVSAREHLSATLSRYAEVSLKVRNSQRRARSDGPNVTRLPWVEVQPELTFFPLFEEKLREAKTNFTRTIDLELIHSWLHFPIINRLPQEVLVRIFQFVRVVEPCDFSLLGQHGTIGYPRYPDYLAQVCAHWRDIALASPSLWCHIDLAPHPRHHNLLLARAKDHADRAGQLPLEVHVTDIVGATSYYEEHLRQFLASIANRTRSLQISRNCWHIISYEKRVFEELLRGGSDMFIKLTTHSQSLNYAAFIEPTSEDNYDQDEGVVTVDLSLEQIEQTLERIKVLHASELFPHWDSKAYHGLVDLRLASHCKTEATQVSQSQFVTILKASPGLRVLHFALQLTNVLSVSMYGDGDGNNLSQVASVLRLITPGSKPLRLTLQTGTYSDPSLLDTIKQFMLRSRISRFCAKKGAPPPYELIECAPHLTDLVFDRCSYDFTSERLPIDLNHVNASSSDSPIRLDSFHIHVSQIYLDDLRLIVAQYPTRSLVMSNCRVYDKASAPGEVSVPKLVSSFAHLSHPPRFLTYKNSPPDPTACWNELD